MNPGQRTGIDPTGLDFNQDGNHDDGFELVGPNIVSGVSLTTAVKVFQLEDLQLETKENSLKFQLWAADNTASGIINMQGIGAWFKVLRNFQLENSTRREPDSHRWISCSKSALACRGSSFKLKISSV